MKKTTKKKTVKPKAKSKVTAKGIGGRPDDRNPTKKA
jgi:hypothetical protein